MARQSAIDCAKVALGQWPRDLAIIAVAIAGAESSWNSAAEGDRPEDLADGAKYVPWACRGYTSFGLWQINTYWHRDLLQAATGNQDPCAWRAWLFDPTNNALLSKRCYDGRGGSWKDWTTYNRGLHEKYLAEAEEAVRAVEQVPPPPPPPPPPGNGGNGGDGIVIPTWPDIPYWPSGNPALMQALWGITLVLGAALLGKTLRGRM